MCAGMCVSRVVWSTHDAVCGAHYNTHASHTRDRVTEVRAPGPGVSSLAVWNVSGQARTPIYLVVWDLPFTF